MYKQILCPIDGSDSSNRAITEAIKLAKSLHATIRFLHIIDTFHPMLDSIEVGNFNEIINAMVVHGNSILKDAQDKAHIQGVNADTITLKNTIVRVADLIISQAKEWPADLILMGTHGRRGFNHLFMGSDAETVIRTSPVPVLTVGL